MGASVLCARDRVIRVVLLSNLAMLPSSAGWLENFSSKSSVCPRVTAAPCPEGTLSRLCPGPTRRARLPPPSTAIALASRRSGAMSPSSARLPRPSPALAAALLLAATLVTVAEARVQVRPVESTVVLEGFRPSDFADPAVQRDFCAAFTASIDLDERVGALDPAPSRRRFPTLRVLRETPRNPP